MGKILERNSSNSSIWLYSTIIAALFAIILGMIGFMPENGSNFLNSLYDTIRLFFMNFNYQSNTIPVKLELARWLATYTVLASIIKIVLVVFKEQIKSVELHFKKGHYIVCGVNHYSVILINDLLKQGNKVVVIENNRNNEYLCNIFVKNSLIILGNPCNEKVLKNAQARNCKQFIIFSDNDTLNLDILLSYTENFKESKNFNKEPIIIHLYEKTFDSIVNEIEGKGKKDNKTVEKQEIINIQIVNTLENNAKILFRKYPLYEVFEDKGQLNILIVGFNEKSEQIILEIARNAHFSSDPQKATKISVIDIDIDKKKGWFESNYPYINKAINASNTNYKNGNDINYINGDIHDSKFLDDFLGKSKLAYNYVIVCGNDDKKTLLQSIVLQDKFNDLKKDRKIYMNISEDINLAKWIDNNKEKFKDFVRFGLVNDLVNVENIIKESLFAKAKMYNEVYNDAQPNKNENSWDTLSLHKKKSNLALAEHMDNKLLLLGLKTIKKDESNSKDDIISKEKFESIINEKIEEIAEIEHIRWNAFHYTEGWKYNIERNDDKKMHPCLIDWKNLTEKNKNDDRNTIKELYAIIKKTNEDIVIKNK